MDRTTAGKVERGKEKEPAVCVPGPADNGRVDEGAPAKGKDHGRQKTTALKGATNHNHDSAEGEHTLVETEERLGEVARSSGHNVLETKVFESADVMICINGVGEGVTPKEPLERDNAEDTHCLPKQCGGRFATTQAGVEEAEAGNDGEDED